MGFPDVQDTQKWSLKCAVLPPPDDKVRVVRHWGVHPGRAVLRIPNDKVTAVLQQYGTARALLGLQCSSSAALRGTASALQIALGISPGTSLYYENGSHASRSSHGEIGFAREGDVLQKQPPWILKNGVFFTICPPWYHLSPSHDIFIFLGWSKSPMNVLSPWGGTHPEKVYPC